MGNENLVEKGGKKNRDVLGRWDLKKRVSHFGTYVFDGPAFENPLHKDRVLYWDVCWFSCLPPCFGINVLVK